MVFVYYYTFNSFLPKAHKCKLTGSAGIRSQRNVFLSPYFLAALSSAMCFEDVSKLRVFVCLLTDTLWRMSPPTWTRCPS